MKGILSYQLVDPQLPNSEEGWFIENENGAYKVSDLSIKKIVRRFKQNCCARYIKYYLQYDRVFSNMNPVFGKNLKTKNEKS